MVHGDDALADFLLLFLGGDLFGLPAEPAVVAAVAASRGWQARPLRLEVATLLPGHGVARARNVAWDVVVARPRGDVDLKLPCGAGDGVFGERRLHEVDVGRVFPWPWKILAHAHRHPDARLLTSCCSIAN